MSYGKTNMIYDYMGESQKVNLTGKDFELKIYICDQTGDNVS